MAIKDLSDVVRLPRLGKIHLGIRHPEKGYPMKTDYFVLPKDHSDYNKLVLAFGEKPKELRILIPVEDEEQWASQYYKAYNLTYGLVCKGDGDTALRMVEAKTGELPGKDSVGPVGLKEMPCAGKECPDYKAKKCHEVMNLRFTLPEVPGLGIWQIDTGSINSILNINSCAKLIRRAFGRISLIPLKLTLEPAQVNNPQDGKKQTVYVLNLRTDVTMAQLADAAREQAKTFLLETPDLSAEIDLWDKEHQAGPDNQAPADIPKKAEVKTPSAPTEATKAPGREVVPPHAVKAPVSSPGAERVYPKFKHWGALLEAAARLDPPVTAGEVFKIANIGRPAGVRPISAWTDFMSHEHAWDNVLKVKAEKEKREV